MRNEKFIEANGMKFRLRAMPAVEAKSLLDIPPEERRVVQYADISVNGTWVPFENDATIDAHLPHWESLVWLESQVMEHNFGFLSEWEPTRLPAGMASSYNAVSPKYVDGLFVSLISGGMAKYGELCSEYSLEDAFRLLEVLTISKINEFLARESMK